MIWDFDSEYTDTENFSSLFGVLLFLFSSYFPNFLYAFYYYLQ